MTIQTQTVRLNHNIRNISANIIRQEISALTQRVTLSGSVQPRTVRATASGAIVYTGTSVIACTAGEIISALKCVRGDADGKVYICSNLEALSIVGIAITSASINSSINVRTGGLIEDLSWNWSESLSIFCGANGVLTQNPPVEGYLVPVGIPVSPTSLIVNIRQAILLT